MVIRTPQDDLIEAFIRLTVSDGHRDEARRFPTIGELVAALHANEGNRQHISANAMFKTKPCIGPAGEA